VKITRDEAIGAIRSLLPALERCGDDVRLVGTASSLLRGIELPAGDVDILAKDRAVVDQLAHEADDAGGMRAAGPRWIDTPFGGQYIADYDVGGVLVEFSTVELSVPDPSYVAECAGDAPWLHFDTIDVEGYAVLVVASELRLLSDVIRGRADRWLPIAWFLSEHGYDERLLSAAMARVPSELGAEVRQALAHKHEGRSTGVNTKGQRCQSSNPPALPPPQ
jgi:hypothetical protein